MSVANFIPEIWATGILKERDKVMVAANHCTKEYEGQIKQKGDRVKIMTVGDVVSYDYSRNADINAPDQLNDEAQWLDIDQAKYCHIAIDDIDKTQANESLMTEGQRKLGIKMADDVDSFIFGLYAKIAAAQTVDAHTAAVTSLNVITYLANIRQRFKEANVPNGETIYLELAPAIYTKFVLARIAKDTDNSKIIDNGEVAKKLYGIEIHESNNIVLSTNYKCLARTKGAIAYASQLTETVGYRPERRFGDAVKSLQVWGAKIIRPRELILFDAAPGAEV